MVPKPKCLEPKDLNRALQRENYPLPTIEEVASRLRGAKVLTVLDVVCGFSHAVLDDQSSFLTAFNTPFGRYRWKRMPFGIKSAPEIFQSKMHELIEGLNRIKVKCWFSRALVWLSHLYAYGTDVCCTLYTHRNRRMFEKSLRVPALAENCIRCQRLRLEV